MIYYVAHRYEGDVDNIARASSITHNLQVKDPDNAYLCPLLAMMHLEYNELSWETEMEICKDFLSVCDCLIVASPISKGVQAEIDFANLVGMEVRYIEEQNT